MIWLISILSGYLYWKSGRENSNRFWRLLGCPLLFFSALLFYKIYFWQAWQGWLALGLNIGAISTYNDWLGEEGVLSTGEPYQNENMLSWVVTGFFYGIASLPLAWCGLSWEKILLRAVILAILIPVIRKVCNAEWAERLSGFVYLASLIALK